MYEIREFCDRINDDKPNIFKDMQDRDFINSNAETIDDLNEAERKAYEREVSHYYNNYLKTWKDVI